jgi:pyruvate dehydrogenase E2 component (dihydrolipoamide acetyltransferase)
VLEDGSLGVATAMTITGSFDHRAIDGADGAKLMAALKDLIESAEPAGLTIGRGSALWRRGSPASP